MDALAQTLSQPTSIEEALLVLTQGAVHAIPGASHASISVLQCDGKLETVAATDPLIIELDARQYAFEEGPCYDTVAESSETFLVAFDLAKDDRWPRYGPVAAEKGIRAQLAVLLSRNGKERSALNVYASQPHDFNHDSIETAEMFASHASLAMGFVRTVETLSNAIGTRQTIGQATGIVMERYQIDEERAFAFLVRISRDSNVKLRDVAADFVTGLSSRTRFERPDG
jgi:GAF domain-containing protein